MNKEKKLAYLGLLVYINLGVLLRIFITFPCGSGFAPIHDIVKPWSIGFIISSIIFGLITFIYRDKIPSGIWQNLKNVGQGAITGFSAGWGGISIIILIFNLCS